MKSLVANQAAAVVETSVPALEVMEVPTCPAAVQLAMTEACNNRCIHCDLWQTKRQHEELSTDHWIKVIDELADWLHHRQIHFTGGEPFLRKDFLQVVRHAAVNRGLVVSANTSGSLIQAHGIKAIIDASFNGLVFSMDGDSQLHGKIRGSKSLFDLNIHWMERLRQHMYVTINTVIMEKNLGQLSQMARLAADLGLAGIGFQPLFQNFGAKRNRYWYRTSKIWPKDIKAVEDSLDELIEMKADGYPILNSVAHLNLAKRYFHSPEENRDFICRVGQTNLAVSPYGEVRLCYQMQPIGNIKSERLSSLWISDRAAKSRLRINRCHRSCCVMNCNYSEE